MDDCRLQVAKEVQAAEEATLRAEELEEERSRMADKLATLKQVRLQIFVLSMGVELSTDHRCEFLSSLWCVLTSFNVQTK